MPLRRTGAALEPVQLARSVVADLVRARRDVAIEDLSDARCKGATLDDKSHLRVESQRPRIEVERTDEQALAVDGEAFRMQTGRTASERTRVTPLDRAGTSA